MYDHSEEMVKEQIRPTESRQECGAIVFDDLQPMHDEEAVRKQ